MSINANALYYNMVNMSSSSSSGENSYSVLIKKAMAKMPVSLNTKKSIDEYYKTAMEKINLKIKAAEKAKKAAEAAEKFIAKAKMAAEKAAEKARKAVAKPKAVKGSKTAKKPRAKKVVGGGDYKYFLGDERVYNMGIIEGALPIYNQSQFDYNANDEANYKKNIIAIYNMFQRLHLSNTHEDITNRIGNLTFDIYDYANGRKKINIGTANDKLIELFELIQ